MMDPIQRDIAWAAGWNTKCNVCKKELPDLKPPRLYCSDECRDMAQEKLKQHAEYWKED